MPKSTMTEAEREQSDLRDLHNGTIAFGTLFALVGVSLLVASVFYTRQLARLVDNVTHDSVSVGQQLPFHTIETTSTWACIVGIVAVACGTALVAVGFKLKMRART